MARVDPDSESDDYFSSDDAMDDLDLAAVDEAEERYNAKRKAPADKGKGKAGSGQANGKKGKAADVSPVDLSLG